LTINDFRLIRKSPLFHCSLLTARHRPNLEIKGLTPDMGRWDEIVIARREYVA
jgi:hypothetical protein